MKNTKRTANTNTNNNTHTHAAPSPFEVTAAARDAIPANEVLAINIDCVGVVSTILGVAPHIRELEAEIKRELPNFPIDCVHRLETCALALDHSHSRYLTAANPIDPLPALGADAVPLRDSLRLGVVAAADRGVFTAENIAAVGTNRGYADLATDLRTLSLLFRGWWSAVTGRTFVTLDELDRADALADSLRHAIGRRENPQATIASATEDRRRAFTYLITTYAEVRRAIAYIRFPFGDADDIAPSVYSKAWEPPRKPAPDAPVVPEPAPGAPGTAPVATPGTAPAPAAPAGHARTVPNENPFASS